MFSYQFPGRIIFGRGVAGNLGGLLPQEGNIAIVCGGHAEKFVREEIFPQLEGRKIFLYSGVKPEPDIDEVEHFRENFASIVIGIGGGSAMDCAKILSMLMTNPGSCADYFYKRASFSEKGVFFAALPTTAGTGAEVTSNAVLTDPRTGIKQSVKHEDMFADLALVDPELTFGAPPSVTAGSGMDALTQTIEGYCSLKSTAGSRALSAAGAELILKNLRRAVNDDHDAREAVAEGSLLGAMAFAQSSLGSVHGIGHPLGSILHIPHGLCCAVLLLEVLKHNYRHDRTRLDSLAAKLGFSDGKSLLDELSSLRAALGLPENFRNWKLGREHYQFIIKNCRSGSMKTNPCDFSDSEVEDILEALS